MQRLSTLSPEWIEHGGRIVGVLFVCPVCSRWGSELTGAHSVGVLFANPADGAAAAPNDDSIIANYDGKRWHRSGDEFDTLSLSPSINVGPDRCWHGHVIGGVVT